MSRPGPVNLASRRFRNETLPAAGFAAAVVGLLALTAWQVSTARRLLPVEGRTLYAEAEALDAELSDLRDEARRLSEERVVTDRLEEWRLVQRLVDRRTFSWTALLGRLEALLPRGVRLVAIAPELRGELARIELDAVARTREEGFDLVRVLQESGGFSGVLPLSVTPGDQGEQFNYTMNYHPEAWEHAVATPPGEGQEAPAPPDDDTPAAEPAGEEPEQVPATGAAEAP